MKKFNKDWLNRNTISTYRFMSFDDWGSDGNAPPPKKDDKGSTGYTEDEVNKRVEAARRDEKAKLYEELNGLRKAKDDLQTEFDSVKSQIATLTKDSETATKERDDLQAKHDALVAAQKEEDGSVDTEKLIKEVTQRISQSYEESSGKTMTEMKQELARLREEKRISDLAIYRQQKIAESGNEIIAELVRGNTEDEINKSVEEAKEAYKKYIKKSSDNDDGQGGGTPPLLPLRQRPGEAVEAAPLLQGR